jgi:acetolactate decarboxylase
MKKLLFVILALQITGCTPEDKDMIFHYSVLKALDNGILEGTITTGELKKHGDNGLGTFNELNGEMIMLDHVVYRISADGKILKPGDETLVPYSIVSFFNQDESLKMEGQIDYPSLKAYIEERLPSQNLFYAFRIKGEFEYIKCGGANKQEKPYNKSLTEMTANRPVFEEKNLSGTLIGFWCPAYIGDINSIGFHLHFLSDDHTIGGHLMEFHARSLDISYDVKSIYKILLPDTKDFQQAHFRSEKVNY